MLKHTFAGITLLGSFVLSGCQTPTVLTTADHKQLVIPAGDQRYIAVNYLASWCESCRKEIPGLNRLSKSYKKQLLLLGVNYDQTASSADITQPHLVVSYPMITTHLNTLWRLPRPQVLPTTYLLNPEHKIIKTFYGDNTPKSLKDWLDNHALQRD